MFHRLTVSDMTKRNQFNPYNIGVKARPTVTSRILRVLRYVIMFSIAIGAFMLLLDYLCSIPIVYESQSTGKCVQVSDVTENHYTCDNMPLKYFHIWVQ